MREVVLLDTSVLCHLLDVPGKAGRHQEVLREFEALHQAGATLTVPLAAVIETGNHVAQCADGTLRRMTARRFAELVGRALRNELPLELYPFDRERLGPLLKQFESYAVQTIGMGDQTIIDAWNDICAKLPTWRVRIWAFDDDLAGYDRTP